MNASQSPQSIAEDQSSALKAVESVIAEHPFLHDLKPKYQRMLADNAMRRHYEPGQLIFREDEPANRFYLIEKGGVSLESRRQDEAAVSVQRIGAGDVLGWSWLFPPYYWHFDARVLEPTTAIFFYGTRMREQCEEDHDLGYELMKRMTQVVIGRLQSARKQLLEVTAREWTAQCGSKEKCSCPGESRCG